MELFAGQEIGSTAVGVLFSLPSTKPVERRRKISSQAGKALEILGHAIEYLIDEHVHNGGSFRLNEPMMETVKMLMAANRSVYYECPEVTSFRERCSAWLEQRTA